MSGIDIETDEQATTSAEAETGDIYCWRFDQLLLAGYSLRIARELAVNGDVDLHLACDLLERGCTEETAFAILA